MKKKIVSAALAACLLFSVPLPLSAAQALPAGGLTTFVSDDRYIDAGWLNQAVVLSRNGQSWAMGIGMMKDYPVFLSDDGGVRQCVIGDSAVIDVFLSSINEQLKSQVAEGEISLFDNGEGSYVRTSGQVYYQLKDNVKAWILTTLQQQFAAGTPQTLALELTDEYVSPVVIDGEISYSSDFVKAGSCTTSFSTSSSNRITNLKVASGHLNNMVVMPGQEVSVSTAIKPRTAANGYRSADGYVNGKTVPVIGGGICQVSSTVYNAVKNAGLTVLERHPHSMPVHYLPLGLDAAISKGSKDLRFRNDYSAPVILQAYTTKGKNLIVNCLVWDQDLNGRSYKLWSEETGSLSAKTYFTTYQDGKKVNTQYVGTSRYNPSR